jgi:hypothetical protein
MTENKTFAGGKCGCSHLDQNLVVICSGKDYLLSMKIEPLTRIELCTKLNDQKKFIHWNTIENALKS